MTRARFFATDRAEVGVGTLIVFIAMVLVAAVAAAVIISTSGALQQRAQATGKEATENVASNLRLVAIYGNRNDTSSELYDLHFQVSPAAGAVPIDLTRLLIRYSDGNRVITYNHSDASLAEGSNGGTPQTWYNATWIRGAGIGSVAQSGDLVDIHFNLYSTSLPERESVEIVLLPETGEPVHANFISPATYGVDLTVLLR